MIMESSGKKGCRGFTLIEVIVVMVIIGLLAVIASPIFTTLPGTRAYHAARKLRSDVRYAQLLALETQSRTRVAFDSSGNTYSLEREVSPNNWAAVINPSTKSNYQVALNSGVFAGVVLSQVSLGGNAVLFDSYGAPYNAAGAALVEPAFVELNATYRLNFRAATGKVDLS